MTDIFKEGITHQISDNISEAILSAGHVKIIYNAFVEQMILDGYIDKQWTPEERQEWMDKMVMKK